MKTVPRWSTCEIVRNAVPQMWVNCSRCWGGWLNIKQQQTSPQIFLWYCCLVLKGLLNRQSVQFSCSVMSDSLRPHGLQYARLPCPSPIPEAYLNSCPLSWWCHPTISSTVVSSSRLQSFQVPRFFQMSWLFISSGKVLEFQLQHWMNV